MNFTSPANSPDEKVPFKPHKLHRSLATPDDELSPQPPTRPWYYKKRFILFTAITFVTSILLTIVVTLIYWYLSSFVQAAGITRADLIHKVESGFNTQPQAQGASTNFLILGIDEIIGQKNGSLLTDTIIVAFLNHEHHTLTLLSIPRDLWVDALKTKVNALYYYGEISEDTSGSEFASEIISQIIGVPIHYTIVIKLDALEAMINSLDGIDIDVPQTFTDSKFPKKDVDVHVVTDPELLYETITFNQGTQHMDGQTALKYIRSRSSGDLTEGTDLARSRRQMQLLHGMIHQLVDRSIFTNPHILGNLYQIYHNQVVTNLTDEDIIGLVKLNLSQFPDIKTLSFTISGPDSSGLLVNPPLNKYKQWVYEPVDPSWNSIHDYLAKNLDQ